VNSALKISKVTEAFARYENQIILGEFVIKPVDKCPELDVAAPLK
jgi:hypothetical protein